MNRVNLIKILDKIIGRPLSLILPRFSESREKASAKPKRILVIRPGGIGDGVLLLPAIKALRNKFPDSRLDILCERRNAGIFGLSKGIDITYLYDKGTGLFRCLGNKYDVVIDTEQWHRLSAVTAYFTRADIRIGFNTNERGRLFTHRIPYSHDDYEVHSFFHLMEPLIGNVTDFNPNTFIAVPEDMQSDILCAIPESGKFATIFPGASVKERRWGGERFGKVAKALRSEGCNIVILGSHEDKTEASLIKKDAPDAIDLTGKTSVRDVAAALQKCRVLITADSGLMHIACASGTPTVSLFGPGREKKWAPRGKKHIVLNKHLACSPCTTFGYTPRCKKAMECLSSITVDEVIDAAKKILA